MNKDNTIISLELLVLNDLYNAKAIGRDLYDKARQKLASVCNIVQEEPAYHEVKASA